ncbi:anti-sigma factor family protein [Paracoccus caeni]|nr:hypothetical protein [Paracoccus caeni]
MQIDDDTLMAFADGELEPAEALEVKAAVEADPALQARLHLFTKTRAMLQADIPAAQPSSQDEDLIARIRAASVAPAQVAGPATLPKPANFNLRPFATAIAAAFALAVAGGIWWQARGPDQGGIGAAQVAALNELPSGEMRTLGEGDLTMIASYRMEDGAFCREYQTTGDGDARVAVACRDADGWAERFAADLQIDGGYQPASGDIPGLDGFLTSAGASAPLTAAEEATALSE